MEQMEHKSSLFLRNHTTPLVRQNNTAKKYVDHPDHEATIYQTIQHQINLYGPDLPLILEDNAGELFNLRDHLNVVPASQPLEQLQWFHEWIAHTPLFPKVLCISLARTELGDEPIWRLHHVRLYTKVHTDVIPPMPHQEWPDLRP